MANEVGYERVDAHNTTFKSAFTRGSDELKFVKIGTSETIEEAADGEKFIGRIDEISAAASDSGNCSVQDRGYFNAVSYSGSDPSLNDTDLYAGDTLRVKAGDGSGVSVVVVQRDTTLKTVSFRLK